MALQNLYSDPRGAFGGLAYFEFVPREWLANDVTVNPETGAVTVISLLPDKAWLRADCTADSMGYAEKMKQEKAGTYLEAQLTGVVMRDELERALAIGSMPYHEYVVRYYDRNRQRRVIGNRKSGMRFSADFSTGDTAPDSNKFTLSFTHVMEGPAPAYRP